MLCGSRRGALSWGGLKGLPRLHKRRGKEGRPSSEKDAAPSLIRKPAGSVLRCCANLLLIFAILMQRTRQRLLPRMYRQHASEARRQAYSASQKHQHPRQIELIILSTFASSWPMARSVPSSCPFMGRPTPSDESAVPDELVPGAAAWCRRRRPSWTYPSWTYETIPCHALPYRRGQTPRWLKRQLKGRCKERKAFSFQGSLVSPARGRL
jgi:hypothetical protein